MSIMARRGVLGLCGIIGGDGINDESNKTSPAPTAEK